jgi:peptidoglycan-N-acetylglucosamine deacetylase
LLYLTFDDGPDPRTTPYLLELLEESGVSATFFLIGENVERYPELVQQIYDRGHLVANHTYSHSWMPTLRVNQIEREINITNQRIEEVTGVKPHLFRPPYGIMDKRAGDCLREQGMTPVYWGSAPEDWSVPGTQRVIRRVMAKVSDGTVIVLHEGKFLGKQTIQAAKEIIYRCKHMGYELAKVEVSA